VKYYWLLGIGLLLYSLTASAAETTDFSGGVFDSPDSLSKFTVWSFNYTAIPTNKFDETKVFFGPAGAKLDDDKYLVGVLTNTGVFSPNPLTGKGVVAYFVRDNSPGDVDGLTVYVTHMGLQEGEYALLALAYDDKLLRDTSETKVKVINPVAKPEVDQTTQKLTEATTQLESLKESKEQISKKFNDLLDVSKQSYEELNHKLDSLSEAISGVQTQTDALDDQTKTALTEMQSNVKGIQSEVQGLLAENVKQKEEATKAGFLNLSALGAYGSQALVGIVIAAILAGGLLAWKTRKSDSKLSDSDFESSLGGGLASWGGSSKESKPSPGLQSSGAHGKWAMPGAGLSAQSSRAGSSRKFGMGSLVRK